MFENRIYYLSNREFMKIWKNMSITYAKVNRKLAKIKKLIWFKYELEEEGEKCCCFRGNNAVLWGYFIGRSGDPLAKTSKF